ncbi:YbhB/YbcL family Raf kinase inhibitor-like protein [Granulicella mallensis]|uniref:YbhB/YbcL family Raf kinase inhibitor-like protein n=1 Tax=Granulicella mallensis TaxID=940614 RepID=UPI001CBF9677
MHHYVFTLYALDVPHREVSGDSTGANVRAALDCHIIARDTLTGTYSLNPRLQKS